MAIPHQMIVYPEPLAEFQSVIADSGLFNSTLETFHETMGTRLRYPSVGGTVLDLHKLFVEVTKRGGASEVLAYQMWKEIVAEFDFPLSIKNPHLKVRDHYMSFLYHYEQVYFFNAKCYMQMRPGSYAPGSMVPFIICGHGTNLLQSQRN